jgi:hypothetical protein
MQFAGADLAERFPARGVRLARMIPIQPGRDEMVNDLVGPAGASGNQELMSSGNTGD